MDLGATKLNKILWYADITSYLYLEKPIIGETYIKRQYGPVPIHAPKTIAELVNSQQIVVRPTEYFGYPKREYIALTKPDLTLFSADEISIVDELIDVVCREFTAKAISETTHDKIWQLAQIGEEIPYCAVFASRLGEIDETDIAWAKQVLMA